MSVAIRNTVVVALLLIVSITSGVLAQDAEVVDRIVSQDSLSLGEAAFLLYRAAIQDNPPQDVERAMAILRERHGRFRTRESDSPVTLSEFALIGMNAFRVPGGLMYTLTDMPRYAYREAVYRRLIQGRSAPRQALGGDRAFRVVHRLLSQFPPSVFEDTERIRADIAELRQQIDTFGLRVFDPPSFTRGMDILQQADARRETQPAEAFQDYERAETALRIVVNTGFPVVIEDRRRETLEARSTAVAERADTSLPDEFNRLDSLLSDTERLRRQGLFPQAFEQYQDLTQRFLALASITRELREEAERAVDDAETRLREIRDEE